MQGLWHEARLSARALGRSPGFTAVAVLTLAIGIGANTAIFSIVNAVLLRPLPYPDADRLVFVRDIQPQLEDLPASYPEFLDWKELDIFEEVAAYSTPRLTFSGEGEPERVHAIRLSPSLSHLLGLQPLIGRLLVEEDDHRGAERVVVLSHSLWQRRYGRDPGIIGQPIEVDGESATVVGVLRPAMDNLPPTEFRREGGLDLWLPLRLTVEESPRGWHYLTVVARLSSGLAFSHAQERVETAAEAFKEAGRTEHGIMLVSVNERLVGDSRRPVLLLMGAVGFVLLIACANVANLLLVRASSRQREMAIRSALGAGRLRLIRHLLAESLLLAVTGGVGGLLLAAWGVRIFSASQGADLLRTGPVPLDLTVLQFSAGLTLVTSLIVGMGPAFQTSRVNLATTLKEGSHQSGAPGRRQLLHSGLVAAEVGLSLILLVGSGLLLRSFQNLLDVELGFDPDNLLTFSVSLPGARYDTDEKRAGFFDAVLERLTSLPGVDGAGLVTRLPTEGGWNSDFNVEGMTWPEGHSPLAETRSINPGYFRLMRIPLLQGRFLRDTDTEEAQHVVVVDQELVRQVFGGDDALGRRIYGSEDGPRWEIVGVVGNVEHWGIGEEIRPSIYFPYHQELNTSAPTLIVRTATDPSSLVGAVRDQILAVDPDQPISRVRTMHEVVAARLANRRFSLTLLTAFALLALFLACLGLYGVISHSVGQRTHELGVRKALGAQAGDLLRMVYLQGSRPVLLGVLFGLAGALALNRLLESLLFGISGTDPVTFATVTLVLLTVAALACYLPARAATRVDPVVALRQE